MCSHFPALREYCVLLPKPRFDMASVPTRCRFEPRSTSTSPITAHLHGALGRRSVRVTNRCRGEPLRAADQRDGTRKSSLHWDNWVELRGFEPLTPSMRTRCATGLRYSPESGGPACGPTPRLAGPGRRSARSAVRRSDRRLFVEAGHVNGVHALQGKVFIVDCHDVVRDRRRPWRLCRATHGGNIQR
jgi:hypothetical protein